MNQRRSLTLVPAFLAASVLVLLLGVEAPPPVQADSPPNVTVQIGDTTFSTWTVTVAAGGSVTWTNVGTQVHSATAIGNPTFDTGGLATGQSATVPFSTPGNFHYTSATDCENGNANPTFNCAASYMVVVTPGPVPPPVNSLATKPMSAFSVQIGDTTFSIWTLTVRVGSTVTWTNVGTRVHSATSTAPNPIFDTGGLAAGQSATTIFPLVGTFAYSSAPDCLNGNADATFNCAAYYAVVVTL